MTATKTPSLPIRRIDTLEIPITGTWPVVRASSVIRSTRRRQDLRQVHVLAGRLEVGEDPVDSSLRIDLDDSTLTATAVRIAPSANGMSEWHFEGFAQNAERRDPLTLTMSYHGVFRRGIDVWAWVSGTGTIGTPAERRGLRRLQRSGDGTQRVVVDLLFTAPDVTRIPRIELERTSEARVMQLPSIGSQPVVLSLDGRVNHPSFT
jgi:hypothetical protein